MAAIHAWLWLIEAWGVVVVTVPECNGE